MVPRLRWDQEPLSPCDILGDVPIIKVDENIKRDLLDSYLADDELLRSLQSAEQFNLDKDTNSSRSNCKYRSVMLKTFVQILFPNMPSNKFLEEIKAFYVLIFNMIEY